ncbi:immunoglobulin superfamily member 6 [Rousettus aegyptiacus]|uniref:immunoglobulin superfamily member 6 n=1 Tax=Rousettus aegyptiacus TaxID=9407 RepID=UPI00168D37B7|nr:immunoglobulin superfamily member 6 [Rousettus aegyptiacus]KAF6440766.1 immunoglobulin superfamily member 6 [Rousettus aegyptiacus]
MALGLHVGLILFFVGAAGGCTVSVSQPPVLEVDGAQGAATVPCSFSTAGCPPKPPTSLWFRLGARRLESLCSDGCQSEADKFTVRMDLARGQVSLTVHGVTANDSALYICGVAVTSSTAWQAKRAGEGTALVVRGTQVLSTEVRWLLIALTSLLAIYLVGVLVVFSVLSASKSNLLKNKETEDPRKKMSARRIFQEIAQELYSKRHAGTSPRQEKDDRRENRSARCVYERP